LASESCEGYRGFRLKVESRSIGLTVLYIYRVEQLDGPLRLLRAEGQGFSACALAGQVVAVGQPKELSANGIRANLVDPKGCTMRDKAREEGNWSEIAIDDLNEAILLDPTYPAAYNDRGNVWRDNKEYDKAIADFTEAIRVDPNFAVA
jgi:tetratricopeptide (TPR) repeat protein